MVLSTTTFRFFLITLIVGTIIDLSGASRILFLLPIASKSHKLVFDPLIKALALKDHEVTVVSPVTSRGLPTSVKEIHTSTVEELGLALSGNGKDLLETRRELQSKLFPTMWNVTNVEIGCRRFYEDAEIKYLMKGLKRFDLAIVSGLQNECTLGLVDFFEIPHIYLTPNAAPNYVVARFGHYFPTSFVPSPLTPFDVRMSFPERTVNFVVETVLVFFAKLYLYPQYEEIYRSYLGEDALSIEEIEDNVGVILMNTNYIMSYPRPLLPNLVEVGGMHCRPARPLATELDKFLSEAEDGFIYFSLGSMIEAVDIPETVVNLLLKVFSNIDQRVIWKWDGPKLKLPSNVMTNKWLPQQDILGHKNIKLFIANGGVISSQECVYHGVPLLGIPLTAEHDLNMIHAEKAGFARTWEILDMNHTRLEELIDRMIIEPEYSAQVKHLSKMYRNIPEEALQKALFWVDYVIRNKGAPYLRTASKDLDYFSYHNVDVIAFLISVLLLAIYLLYCVISAVFCRRQAGTNSHTDASQRNGSYASQSSKKYN